VIELVSAARCIGCHACVEVCPAAVFEVPADGGAPLIARQENCHTCFRCRDCCPVDALFVAPHRCPLPASSPLRDEWYLLEAGLLTELTASQPRRAAHPYRSGSPNEPHQTVPAFAKGYR
jgi:NAD-dependent dihydropyrimidine dehydrogenase PreA subunit